ncbi:Type II secretion system protein GspF domain-containing protein [Sphingomonas antarctica]|uniref:type II secretion system F family protein n=1 Tax=Sphingomonas antarctica TaxID=2040274 RepID=UPI0039EAB2AA
METMPLVMLFGCVLGTFALLFFAFSGPSVAKATDRRLTAVRDRHTGTAAGAVEAQMRRAVATQMGSGTMEGLAKKFLPNTAKLQQRLDQTGKNWTLGKFFTYNLLIALVIAGLMMLKGLPILLCLCAGLFLGLAVPHKAVTMMINRRVAKFTKRFPDAIELLVRGLRSGLPISETLGVVATELPAPVGEEFRAVSDKIKIGKTMDAALQDTADRLGTPEFQFFVISLQIQRETGGNLAETLSNLANVLRGRAQMKLKIKAMASESKASAYIIGSLPFIVFLLINWINPSYMGKFFIDPRLMAVGGGGMVWMGMGAFIMAQMINFEI